MLGSLPRLLARPYRQGCRRLLSCAELGLEAERELLSAYAKLGLRRGCDEKELKEAYLARVRRLHPDTGGAEADVEMFQEVRAAYRHILDSEPLWGAHVKEELAELPPIFDIRHTAPQHRQYLEHDGLGFGTPAQRQKQAAQIRVMQAAGAASQYVVDKMAREEAEEIALATTSKSESDYARRWKTRNAMDRLVEDLILESMAKGEFADLPGKGKPLPLHDEAPHVDQMTQKINRILINNGFVPEWITAEKELRECKEKLREKFRQLAGDFARQLETEEWLMEERAAFEQRWKRLCAELDLLNKDIDRFNLIVPILHRQQFHLGPKRELERARQEIAQDVSLPRRSNELASSQPSPSEPEPGSVLKSLLQAIKAK